MKEGKFTKEDIEDAKKLIISSIKSISAEQDTEITYNYGQELSKEYLKLEDYEKKVTEVSKEQIINLANTISINTIYFLKK